MARPHRPDAAGLLHHVTNRGNGKRSVLHDDGDRLLFLEELVDASERFKWLVLDYCLMPTHFHLLLECPEAGLSKGMQRLESRFVRRRHARHGGGGHLFEGRFKSRVVDTDEYLLMALAYIARNPVKARLCATTGEWRWSGHAALVHGQRDRIVAVDRVYELLTGPGGDGRRRYLGLIDVREKDVPPPPPLPIRPPLVTLLRDPGDAALLEAHDIHGYAVRPIAQLLGCSPATVSRRLKAARNSSG